PARLVVAPPEADLGDGGEGRGDGCGRPDGRAVAEELRLERRAPRARAAVAERRPDGRGRRPQVPALLGEALGQGDLVVAVDRVSGRPEARATAPARAPASQGGSSPTTWAARARASA